MRSQSRLARSMFLTSSVLAVCGALANPGFSQDAKNDEPTPIDVPLPALGDPNDPHEQMKQLFGKVETRLREIDRLLRSASSGDTKALAKAGPAGLDELLKESGARSREAVESIDKILEIAQHEHPSSGGQCKGGLCKSSGKSGSSQGNKQGKSPGSNSDAQGQPSQGQGSPLDRMGETSTQREATPTGPGSKERAGEEPGSEGGTKPNGDTPGGEEPRGNRASKDVGRNSPGKDPARGASENVRNASSETERWGDLPVHARDVFVNQGGTALPSRYRDWIDQYYKKLNKKP
jgi:hypothetical protein